MTNFVQSLEFSSGTYYIRDNTKIAKYNSVTELLTAEGLKENMIVYTSNYDNTDGSECLFKIVKKQPSTPFLKFGSLFLEYLPLKSYNLSAFGFKENDDISGSKINNILLWLANNRVELNITNNYLVTLGDDIIIPSYIVINGNNKTIKGKTPYNLTHYNIFKLNKSNNVIINNVVLDGVRDGNQSETGEWGHCIQINDSINVEIKNCNLINAFGDGIELGSTKAGKIEPIVNIHNCVIDNCRRQGISVLSGENIRIHDCTISNIYGTEPMAAIDIEPWFIGQQIKNVLIENINIINCYRGITAVEFKKYVTGVTNISLKNIILDGLDKAKTNGCNFSNVTGDNNYVNIYIDNLSAYQLYGYALGFNNIDRTKTVVKCTNCNIIDCGYKYNVYHEARPIQIIYDNVALAQQNKMGGIVLDNVNFSYGDGKSQQYVDICHTINVGNTNWKLVDMYIKTNTNKIDNWKNYDHSIVIVPNNVITKTPEIFDNNRLYTMISFEAAENVYNIDNPTLFTGYEGLELTFSNETGSLQIGSKNLYPRTTQIGENGTKSTTPKSSITIKFSRFKWVVTKIVGNWTAL